MVTRRRRKEGGGGRGGVGGGRRRKRREGEGGREGEEERGESLRSCAALQGELCSLQPGSTIHDVSFGHRRANAEHDRDPTSATLGSRAMARQGTFSFAKKRILQRKQHPLIQRQNLLAATPNLCCSFGPVATLTTAQAGAADVANRQENPATPGTLALKLREWVKQAEKSALTEACTALGVGAMPRGLERPALALTQRARGRT
eukprot:2593560-Rhodomonas_salina.8